MKYFSFFICSIFVLACTKPTAQIPVKNNNVDTSTTEGVETDTFYSYLALGDSYTVGQSVATINSFPAQLQSQLIHNGLYVNKLKIIATTGWTTTDLQRAIASSNLTQKFDFVTLLIGVNDQYQGYLPDDNYKARFTDLLNQAIGFANGNKNRVFVVSIPDWSVTPFGQSDGRGQATISAEIDAFNSANKAITLAAGVSYTDITPASRNALTDPTLLAPDGLHPSAKMYMQWADSLLPKVTEALK